MTTVSFDQIVANLALAKKQAAKAKVDFLAKLEKWNAVQNALGISINHISSVQRVGAGSMQLRAPIPLSGKLAATVDSADLNPIAKDLAESIAVLHKANDVHAQALDVHQKALLDAGAA